MKGILFVGMAIMLVGCANWTPEQHQNFSEALQRVQNNLLIQRQQNIEMMRATQPRMGFGTRCVSRPSGVNIVTTCD